MSRNQMLPIIAAAAIAAAVYYGLRKEGSLYREPRTEPIPLPRADHPQDALIFRFAICNLSERKLPIDSDSVLNIAYESVGARWPTVAGDHPSMTDIKPYADAMIAEHNADPAAFCQTGFAPK